MLIALLDLFRIRSRVERALVRYTGYSLLSRHVTRRIGVSYVPTLLLVSIGQRSGELREAPLFYFEDGDDYFVVGSIGGSPRHPEWYRNLLADPHAWVYVRRRRIAVLASLIEGEERARLWPIAARAYPRYDEMIEEARPREIPLVRLSPRAAGPRLPRSASSPSPDG